MDVNDESNFFVKIQKKNGGSGGRGEGSAFGGGFRVDVIEEF